MYSFYGGRPGNSFVIAYTYPSVSKMVEDFKLGANCVNVNYDQYAMINSTNRNDPDNGKIYKRGYNYSNEQTGGAIYIGTIAGPPGQAPQLQLKKIGPESEQGTIDYIINQDIEDNNEGIQNDGQYSIPDDLIPGKTEDEQGNIQYNDKIYWKSYSVRAEDGSNVDAYIGFKLPYMVLDIEAESVSPYNNNSNSLASRTDDYTHPFYEKWKINIPKGVKGDSVTDLYVDETSHFLTYKTTNYDIPTTTVSTTPIALYKVIDNIDLSNNGQLTVNYSDETTQTFQNTIKWINSVTIPAKGQPDAAKLIINFNNGEVFKSGVIKTIDSIIMDGQGQIFVTYNTSTETLGQVVQWPIDFSMNQQGIINTSWNYMNSTTPVNSSNPIKFINNISLSNNGTLTITYNTLTNEVHDQTVFNNALKSISEAYVENNNLYIQYNTQSQATNIGTIASYNIDNVLSNINWIGHGYITTGESSSILLNFSIPVCGLLSSDIQSATLRGGEGALKIWSSSKGEQSFNGMTLTESDVKVNSTGIKFSIRLTGSSYTAGQIGEILDQVSIILNNASITLLGEISNE